MRRRRALLAGAWIGGIFAVAAWILAGLSAREGRRIRREFEAWEEDRPVRMAVDLSVAGEYRGPLHQTCQMSHGEEIALHVSPAFASMETARAALRGLEGRVRVLRANGEEEYSEVIDLEKWSDRWTPQDDVQLVYFTPFRKGEYVCELKVEQPAAGMAGRQQEVVGRYWLCGCELGGAMVATLICGILVVLGIVAGVVSGVCLMKARVAAAMVTVTTPNPGDVEQSLFHP